MYNIIPVIILSKH